MNSSPAKSLYIKYCRLALMLRRNIESGRFYQWSLQKRQYLVARLLHFRQLLRSKGMKFAASTSLILSSLSFSQAQPEVFFEECEEDPFEELSLTEPGGDEFFYFPLTGDLDNDGDEDLAVLAWIEGIYSIQYFENTPGGLVELSGMDNPLNFINEIFGGVALPPYILSPIFGDIDLDGDLDFVFGEYKGGSTAYLPNQSGVFDEFEVIDSEVIDSYFSSIRFANLDADCELEMVYMDMGNIPDDDMLQEVNIAVFDANNGVYEESPAMLDMFANVELTEINNPYFFDLNADGIDELIIFSGDTYDTDGYTRFFQKIDGQYQELFDDDNPFDSLEFDPFEVGGLLFADFGDLDGDGLLNLYLGHKSIEDILCLESNIPVPEPCVEPIPTLSQWGMYLLGIVLLILGTVGFYRRESPVSGSKRLE